MAVAGFLPQTVHAVARDGDIVFLDVAADRYVCLPTGGETLRLGTQAAVEVADDALADELAAAGLFSREMLPLPRLTLPSLPRRTLMADTYPRPAWKHLGAAGRAVAEVLHGYARRPFGEILLRGARDAASPRTVSDRLIQVVDEYHRWAPFAPLSGKCLLRSFVLRKALQREGLDADWVFGVRTWPFHAHCWLQVEDAVLDDHHERICAYSPLMVV